ncbi:MAG: hypothetical protein ACKV2Q_06035 [Planctomycetaceae bacterium]
MGMHVRGGMLLAVLSAISVMSCETRVSAQWFSGGCRTCQQPVNQCQCQSHQPVVQTELVPRQVMTYRNEVTTQYRQEAITQNVPVTTYHDVVVDEGSYQTVYVPKQVTKRIPQVSYQPQVAYRSVPYQVTRQVPQVVTQMVAQPTVRYQAYQTAVAPVIPCGPCGGVAFAPTPVYQSYQTAPTVGQVVLGRPIIASNPVTMLSPTSTTPSVAMANDADSYSPKPVPDPKFLESPGATGEPWTKVGSRNDGRSASSGSEGTATSSTSGVRFKPARMVFQNWESQSRIAGSEGPERR